MIFYNKNKVLLGISLFLIIFLAIFSFFPKEKKNTLLENTGEIYFSKESGFYKEPFELEIKVKTGAVYYTLDGTRPDKNSIKYEDPILITDASDNDNIYSMRTDVSTGFDKEEIEKISFDYPGYRVPDYKVDKATVIRAVSYDELGNCSDEKTAVYFVNYADKTGYEGMNILSIVTEPSNLFDYETGIYVTGKSYDEYVDKYRGGDEYYWREEFWALWLANYRNRGIEWERKAECQFFDETGKMILQQKCGIRVRGGISRGYNPKSLNIYARKEYDGNKVLQADLFGTGYYPSAVTLFQGGNDVQTKAKDYIVSTTVKNFNVTTMNYKPYVLFLNGEYWGVYWLNEKYNEEYFVHQYGVSENDVIMIKGGTLEVGEEDDLKYYSLMYEFCSQSDITKEINYEKVCEMIDIESYIDYYAIMIYIGRSSDWPKANFGLWRTKKTDNSPYGDDKWRWIIWDLNSAGFSISLDSIEYVMENDAMFKNMMTNDTFRAELFLRIEELADTVFEAEKMNGILAEFQNFMTEPLRKHNKRFLGDDSLINFYEEMEKLRIFFEERKAYLIPVLDKYR
ncbi:CotH kinase family protein [Parablautia intestinalis]|uniref:CotH kinase family protein n=2 Tax=Parablautia intestinalis TaxID=2320100 RepID=UPI00256E9EF8|nr:CotH kinase family protein [Parablautia intestinalis]